MSAQPTSRARAAIEIEASNAPAIRVLSVRWGVSRLALGELAPAGKAALVHLLLRLRSDAAPVWTLSDPGTGSARIIAPLDEPDAIRIRLTGGCLHVRCAQLYAFVRINDPERPELLYARTPIFSRLKIPGGRYQPLGVEIEVD